MKKIITLLLVATSVASVSHAQLQKGNVLVGGNIADFNLGLKKGSTFSMDISPKAAWFLNNNFAVGAYVRFGVQTLGGSGSGSKITYGVGPLARYYVNDPKVNLLQHGRFFAEGTAGIGGTNYTKGSGGTTNGLDLGVGPGYAYFITPNIGLETLLKVNSNVGFGTSSTNSYLDLSVGFQIYLPGKATRDKVMRDESK